MILHLTNTEFNFTYFENLYNVKEAKGELDINQLIEVIKYGYLKEVIEKLRNSPNKEIYNKIKRTQLPAVTLSGVFTERNNKCLQEHSGLIQIDIDHIKNYDEVFTKLTNDEYTFVCFRSPGGKGIKAIVKINPSESTHPEQFYALEKYYKEEYNIIIDTACKDISRCMLLSYDPHLYCNPKSEVFAECFIPVTFEKAKRHDNTHVVELSNSEKLDIIEKITQEIELNSIDITDTYENWIRVGFALSTELGEAGRSVFHRISKFHQDYDQVKCDKQYTDLSRRNNGLTTIGTLIYLVREHNIEIHFSEYSKPIKTKKAEAKKQSLNSKEKPLLELLIEKRLKLSKKKRCAPFLIFKNDILIELADKLPVTQDEFIAIKGIGIQKTEQYAQHFLPIIRKYKGLNEPLKLSITQSFIEQISTTYKFTSKEKNLYESLRKLRLEISQEERIKPYWVFGNSTLTEIVLLKPRTKEQLLGLKGLGPKKIDWFGQDIINIIEDNVVEYDKIGC